MKKLVITFIALLNLFLAGILSAQNVPPVLFVRQNDKLEALSISKVNVNVKIFGYIAETKMTLTFYNPNNRILSGDLYFPLPQGTTISGYGLDINGIMVDGVVVEKQKARQVFEKIVRQGIDPGLVEWVKGNNFKTRVFPIPANGTRTIMVKYVSDIVDGDNGAIYQLPLNFKSRVKDFSLRIEVIKATVKPVISKGNISNFSFKKWRESYIAETKLINESLTKDLLITIPDIHKQKVLVEKGNDGNYYFCINDLPVIPTLKSSPTPNKITIFWDASASRGDTNREKEFSFLRAYFKSIQNHEVNVNLVFFRNDVGEKKSFIIKNANVDQLINTLMNVQYDGGTQMASISPGVGDTAPDYYFLFSDGISNFGMENPKGFKHPVYIFTADTKANHSFLSYLSMSTGGEYFNLTRLSNSEVLSKITSQPYTFLSVEASKSEISESFPSVSQPVYKKFTLVGKIQKRNGNVKISYGIKGKVMNSITYKIDRSNAVSGDLLQRFWAQKKVDELSIFSKRNEKEIIEVGKAHNLVTPGTSLIVLDNINQYVEHKIIPPKSLPDMINEYKRIIAQQNQQQTQQKEYKIQYVLSLWKKRVDWWNTKFTYPKDFKYGSTSEKKNGGRTGTLQTYTNRADPYPDEDSLRRDERPRPSQANGNDRTSTPAKGFSENDDDKYSGTESNVKRKLKREGKSREEEKHNATIEIKPHDPNTPYLNKLKNSSPKDYFDVYIKERKEHGKSPAFYLDVADFLFRKQENKLALQILSNIAELELENAALLRVLAHRLAQLNMLDLSIMLFKEVLKLRPEEPQSYRDLALVLARRADSPKKHYNNMLPGTTLSKRQKDYKQSIDLLYHVVMNQWDRFSEIEVIALTELNRLIPRALKTGIQGIPVDPRLVKLLDVDVRIVLTWDADLTDMDLWVTEPSGEKAYYSHPLSTIGGLVSRDFTQGYGPEEYLLKNAMRGEYKIEANYYSSSATQLIGAVTLQVDVYTNYGRPNEKRKSLTIRLENKRDSILVGKIKF
ncbi:MAG: VIT domain-containing protein [Spirochaetota bacterium]|nr:VIT domain-containing protein [Spirochaetota bacterium]